MVLGIGRPPRRLVTKPVGGHCMDRRRHWRPVLAVALAMAVAACDRPSSHPQPASDVTIRDSAGIEIVENHAPVWDSTEFWTIEPEPENTWGGLGAPPGDSAHLVYGVRGVAPLSDGRVAMVSPVGNRKVLVFEPSGRLSVAFGREGRGPGEFHYPMGFQVLPDDTIVVWDQMFDAVDYFDPSGRLLRERRIDLGAVVAAVRTEVRRPGESVHQPLPDGSFLMKVSRYDWQPPGEAGVIYRQPTGYVRVDSSYTAYSFGWWRDTERFWWPDGSVNVAVPFPTRSLAVAGGNPPAVYISDGDRYEIHQFSVTGALRRIIRRTVDPVPVSDDELEGWKEFAASVYPSLDWRRWERRTEGRLSGRHYQAITVLRVDTAGYLWARDNAREEGRREWSVFNPEGRWLGTVVLPETGVVWIGENAIYGSKSDVDTGVQTVERYRLDRRGRR